MAFPSASCGHFRFLLLVTVSNLKKVYPDYFYSHYTNVKSNALPLLLYTGSYDRDRSIYSGIVSYTYMCIIHLYSVF